MATLKYITDPAGEEYIQVDFTADTSTTGWKYSPWFYYPSGHYMSIAAESESLTGTNQWKLMGSVDPANTDLDNYPNGTDATATSTFSISGGGITFTGDPTTNNTPTNWKPEYPYFRVAFNNGSTSNAGDVVIFTVRFFKKMG